MNSSTATRGHPFAQYPDLPGSSFVVIGTGNGVGEQVVRALAANRVRVACVDISHEAAERAASLAGDGVALQADVREPGAIEGLLDHSQEALGQLRGIIDVVGMLRSGSLAETDDETWRWHFDVVFEHSRRVAREAAHRLAPGSSISYVASTAGLAGVRNNAAYAAAKAAQISLIRSAATEFASSGIRVNGVAPGMVANPRMKRFLSDVEGLEQAQNVIPMGRLVEPEEVADSLLFLSSTSASIITGQIIVLDGGVQYAWPYPEL
ncbi:SDR family NAD(P)-dependent oxidoreductase [Streptomyces sp. NPDC059881]|uniref:SDR family NAD(P)-dependent oxidoreductase n=1 Tax=Streptomyces sp. NPDC059881 TaxID=3346986 RepID=UPI00364EC51A